MWKFANRKECDTINGTTDTVSKSVSLSPTVGAFCTITRVNSSNTQAIVGLLIFTHTVQHLLKKIFVLVTCAKVMMSNLPSIANSIQIRNNQDSDENGQINCLPVTVLHIRLPL